MKMILEERLQSPLLPSSKIYIGKGKFQGNYYLVTDAAAKNAGIVITLTAKDKDGAKATKEGKNMRAGISGVLFSKGIVTFEADTKKLCLAPRKGNAQNAAIKKAIKEVLAKEYGLALLKKSVIGDSGSDEIDATEAGAIELSDLEMSEAESESLLKEMEADEDLKDLLTNPEIQSSIAAMNEALENTFFEDQAYHDELMIDNAATQAMTWWGDPNSKEWTPPPITMPDKIVPTGADKRGSEYLAPPDKQLRFIKRLNQNFDALNAKQLNELIHRLNNYHTQIGYFPPFTAELLEMAEGKLATFQRIKALEKKGVSFDQAEETYLRNLYNDAAKAQLRLSHLLENVKGDLGSETCTTQAPPVHKIKGTERARIKAAENSAEKGQSDFSTLGDLARGSLIFNRVADIAPGIKKFVQRLPAGCIIPKFKNRFADKKPGESHYRDIIMTMSLDNGHLTEMQFHSQEVINAKSTASMVPEESQDIVSASIQRIRRLVKAGVSQIPKDTIGIIDKIEGGDFLLSGHDFYNITRWLDGILPEGENKAEHLKECVYVIGQLAKVANNMYDTAFETATTVISEKEVGRLKNLSADRVRSWIPQS